MYVKSYSNLNQGLTMKLTTIEVNVNGAYAITVASKAQVKQYMQAQNIGYCFAHICEGTSKNGKTTWAHSQAKVTLQNNQCKFTSI